jgi:5-methylcytosine-specific restriction endonuclease McrA
VPLEIHHVNGDPMDNRIANTIPLCRDCHHKATFPGI